MPPPSPRTGSGCWITRSLPGSSPRWSRHAKLGRYVSSDHFSVDGTLLEAWASHKSFKPKDGSGPGPTGRSRNAEVSFHGATPLEPDARLDDRSRGAHGPPVQRDRRQALLRRASVDGTPQRSAGPYRADRSERLRRGRRPRSRCWGGSPQRDDAGPSRRQGLRHRWVRRRCSATLGITPHVAPNTTRPALHDRRAHPPPRRPCRESTDPQTDRRTLRLDQDHRRRPQAPLHRPTTQPSLVPHGWSRLQHPPTSPRSTPPPPERANDTTRPSTARSTRPTAHPPPVRHAAQKLNSRRFSAPC